MTDTENKKIAQRQEADKITLRRTIYGAGTGLIPIPILDAAALLGVQVYMIQGIAKVYDVEFKEQRVKSLITVLVGDVAAIGLFKFVPGLGSFFGGASAAAAGAATTYALGKVFTEHFEKDGTLLDFDARKSKDFFKNEFEKGKKVVVDFTKKATGAKEAEEDYMGELLEKNKALYAEILELQKQVAALGKDMKQAEGKTNLGNLQLVEGIGPKVAAALKKGGIASLKDLAQATPEHIRSILDQAGGNFNLVIPDSWPLQAKLAVEGDMKGLSELQDKLMGGK